MLTRLARDPLVTSNTARHYHSPRVGAVKAFVAAASSDRAPLNGGGKALNPSTMPGKVHFHAFRQSNRNLDSAPRFGVTYGGGSKRDPSGTSLSPPARLREGPETEWLLWGHEE